MKARLVVIIISIFFPLLTIAQNNTDEVTTKLTFGIEGQVYPAGQMYGLRGEYYLSPKSELNLRVGYNSAFRKDFSGLNDNEQGGGWGFTPGYRYNFASGYLKNFFVGARCDFWWLSIDWRDADNTPTTGNTQITVVQPTIDLGYRLHLSKSLKATFSVAFGQEINVVTKGDEVGQGGISLIGATLSKRIF